MTRTIRRLRPIAVIVCFAALGCGEPPPRPSLVSGHGHLLDLSLERFPDAPLTALARFRTSAPTCVVVTIVGLDGEDLSKRFDRYATEHDVPLLGLYPDHANVVAFLLETRDGRTLADTIFVPTPPLPKRLRDLPMTFERGEGATLAPGFFFLLLSKEYGGPREEGMFVALDNFGKVRWYYAGDHWFMAKPLPSGHLVVQASSDLKLLRNAVNRFVERLLAVAGWHSIFRYLYWGIPDTHTPEIMRRIKEDPPFSLTSSLAKWLLPKEIVNHNTLRQIDMLGRELAVWRAEGHSIHHDFIFLPDGDLLALASTLTSDEDLIVRIDTATGTLKRVYDLKDVLDSRRPQMPWHVHQPDWLHANALYYDDRDSTIVISARNQSAIIKLALEPLEVRWILGNHDHWEKPYQRSLFEPVGKEFAWQWGQHAPMLHPDDPTRMLVYDNGNQRSYSSPSPPESSYSRAVEYEIDEQRRTIRQVWEYGKEYGSARYTPVVGNADYLSNGNRLVCFGAIPRDLEGRVVEWIEPAEEAGRFRNRSVKCSAVIAEVSSGTPARTLVEVTISDRDSTNYVGYLVYRAHKISLYGQ